MVLPKIHHTILQMATERGPEKSVCPSEVARQLFPVNWRSHLQEVRNAAAELQDNGLVIVTQKGAPVNLETVKGPVRIKIK